MSHVKSWSCIKPDGDGCDGNHTVQVPAEVWERYRKALQWYAERPQGHYTCGCGASYSFMETADVARQALGSEEFRIEDNLLDGEGPD